MHSYIYVGSYTCMQSLASYGIAIFCRISVLAATTCIQHIFIVHINHVSNA